MSLLAWCLVASVTLPYIAHVVLMGAKVMSGKYDNHHPRQQTAHLTGVGARAWAAEQNAWEAVAVFAPIALLVIVRGADDTVAGGLGVAWVAFRLLHTLFYVTDRPPLRSGSFGLANLAVIGLVVRAAVG